MITFQNITKTYNKHSTALENVSFKINPKEFVSIVGRSGSGKSTIVKLITAEEKPTNGRIIFDSYEVNKLRFSQLPKYRRLIGTIFQDFRLLNGKTVFENIAFALEVEGRPQKEINEFVPQILNLVGLDNKMQSFPYELSGGEKQRVAIARAMINQPEVIVADEPTGNLDPFNTWEIIKLLMKLNEMGSIIILATHNKEIINTLGHRVITLNNGKIIRDEEHGRFILTN
ncbi:MAG: cell division ATP-binding protein FtsE [Candidatus Niyogibacteria bacterium RIFCSPLOWO2_01_FULL_45_48]|uniref:Cell division ATP-binding protein FtsE n=2 Tax=Parcubacteria group TaxID=1794811 RepID=A0A1F6C370_9BACT|nr:MAG: cell division ATP-binding protein FtsE [Candidatus Jorgensenbacteria bacterium RIFCSPLOWO2_12_FULL_42_11]OGZ29583.1 MAG: cell division ATP-binding protein FtsE [Candidatus Niyogibacteria bacterium RIFCSPLOWO2_01_FULL_45_48]